MKDWEISRSYVLPRILYVRGGNDVPSSKLYKPNLRFFSLREECNEWKTWKRSDYFYPEIIPEPDYSDSEDDEADQGPVLRHYFTDPTRSAIERLRELTEVYVSNVDLKKAPSKRGVGRAQARPQAKNEALKEESGKSATKLANKPQQARRSPSPPSKTVPKSATKSASRTQQPRRSPSPPSKTSPKSASKPAGKTKQARRSPSPPSKTLPKSATKSTSKTQAKRSPSPPTKSVPPKSPPKVSKPKASPPSSQTDKSVKTPARPKSPPSAKAAPSKQTTKSPTKETAAKPAPPKGKTTPKTVRKAKTTSKESGVSELASGDSKDVVSKSPSSTPTRGKSPLRSDQSSDDEQLIKPKKPYSQQSTERQKLHQELKFSQRYGKPGSSKTELQLALERYTENKMKRELMAEEKTSLEKILELQAKKIEMQETTDQCPAWVDRLQKPPIVGADPETEEFFRVHARVVSSNSLTHCFLSDDERGIHSDTGSDS